MAREFGRNGTTVSLSKLNECVKSVEWRGMRNSVGSVSVGLAAPRIGGREVSGGIGEDRSDYNEFPQGMTRRKKINKNKDKKEKKKERGRESTRGKKKKKKIERKG